MLLPSDLKYNLKFLQFFSFVGILPLNFDEQMGKISIKTSLWGKFLFKFWQLYSLAHIIYVSFRAVDFLSDENRKVHHVPVLILIWGNIISVAAVAIIAFDFQGDLTVKNFKELFLVLQENKTEMQDCRSEKLENQSRRKKIKIKIPTRIEMLTGKNIYELITIYIPFILYPLLLIAVPAYFLDPDMPIFYISNFSRENRTWWIFGMCLCLELTIYLFYWPVVHCLLFIFQAFIHSTRDKFEQEIEKIKDECYPLALRLFDAQKTIKGMELRINLFNLGSSNVIYIAKLFSMQLAVAGGYGAILLLNKEPFFTVMYGSVFFSAILFYIVVFNRAFQIETGSEELKRGIWIQLQRFRLKWKRDVYTRKILAIRPMGIKQGGFGKVEREAVPIFTGFVIQQIISLLLI